MYIIVYIHCFMKILSLPKKKCASEKVAHIRIAHSTRVDFLSDLQALARTAFLATC